MRRTALFPAVLVAAALATGIAAAQTPPAPPGAAQPLSPPLPPPRPPEAVPEGPKGLDSLFDRLAKAEDEEEARGIANLIERRWLRSGSDVTDLLMARAVLAMQARDQDLPQAIELLDRIIGLEPQWTEAYNKRATAFFALGDHSRSMLDIQQVLTREPRHYGALAGMGQILLAAGDKKRAFEAFRKAQAINPRMPNIKTVIERLKPDVEGRDA